MCPGERLCSPSLLFVSCSGVGVFKVQAAHLDRVRSREFVDFLPLDWNCRRRMIVTRSLEGFPQWLRALGSALSVLAMVTEAADGDQIRTLLLLLFMFLL